MLTIPWKLPYLTFHTCLKYCQGKPVCTGPRHFKLHSGQFWVWKIDFIYLPLSHGYKCVLVMVYIFSKWTEAFPWRQAPASLWLKSFWKSSSLSGEFSLQIYSDWGNHFTGQVLQVCAHSLVWQHFHCVYHPQSPSLVEHTNNIIKT